MYVNPYQSLSDVRPLRVNFHTHAGTGVGTCGRNPIDQVAALYRELGYDALCLSNHDLYTDASAYSDGKMRMLDGVEYSPRTHMLTVGIRRSLHEMEHQSGIDETRKDGGFVILCHPNWQHKEYWPWADMDRLTGYWGLEVINQLIYRLSGSGLATDAWDHLLSSGRLVYGFGNDDFHLYSDAGRSWNWIYAPSSAFSDIRNAVEAGRFTASTGLTLDSLILDGENTLTVRARHMNPSYVDTFTYRFITEGGRTAAVVTGRDARFTLTEESYVRVEALGENGAMLFTQPVYDPARLQRV